MRDLLVSFDWSLLQFFLPLVPLPLVTFLLTYLSSFPLPFPSFLPFLFSFLPTVAFRILNHDKSGEVSKGEFVQVIQSMYKVLETVNAHIPYDDPKSFVDLIFQKVQQVLLQSSVFHPLCCFEDDEKER
jgi:hypothetical protein